LLSSARGAYRSSVASVGCRRRSPSLPLVGWRLGERAPRRPRAAANEAASPSARRPRIRQGGSPRPARRLYRSGPSRPKKEFSGRQAQPNPAPPNCDAPPSTEPDAHRLRGDLRAAAADLTTRPWSLDPENAVRLLLKPGQVSAAHQGASFENPRRPRTSRAGQFPPRARRTAPPCPQQPAAWPLPPIFGEFRRPEPCPSPDYSYALRLRPGHHCLGRTRAGGERLTARQGRIRSTGRGPDYGEAAGGKKNLNPARFFLPLAFVNTLGDAYRRRASTTAADRRLNTEAPPLDRATRRRHLTQPLDASRQKRCLTKSLGRPRRGRRSASTPPTRPSYQPDRGITYQLAQAARPGRRGRRFDLAEQVRKTRTQKKQTPPVLPPTPTRPLSGPTASQAA